MKKMNQTLGVLALSCALVACGGNQKKAENQPEEETVATLSYSSSLKAPETDNGCYSILFFIVEGSGNRQFEASYR